MFDSLIKDIRYGARVLIRKPGFTITAVLTLALGIAATTATFTVIDAVLLRKLPVADPDRVVAIHNQLPKINLPRSAVSASHGGCRVYRLLRACAPGNEGQSTGGAQVRISHISLITEGSWKRYSKIFATDFEGC